MFRRPQVFSAVIALPAALVIGLGAVYVLSNVPGWIRAEPGRVTREYRETAEALLASPERAETVGARRTGWRQVGRVDGRPWGYVEGEGRACVWVRVEPDVWRFVEVPVVRRVPYALVFYWGGSLVAAMLVAMTAFAIWSFVRFLRERDDFLAATAHDLTTPLVGMRYMIGRDDAEAKALNERMIRLVANIKDFLRLGSRPAPKVEKVDLGKACRDAYALFRADYRDLFDGADVPIEVDAPEGCETVLAWADATLILQILWNLLGNDLKYAAPYGPVRVRIGVAGRFARVEVCDEGKGMSPREMRRAFDRYYRAKTAMETGKGGFGIGLCTAREFARAMGGDLTVRANEPHGCVFALDLIAA